MTTTTKTVKRPLRNAGFGYTGVMVLIFVILVVTLLSAPRSTPPAIAEIAPQAVEQIQEGPPEQAANFGGSGIGGLGGTTTTTTAPTTGLPPGSPGADVTTTTITPEGEEVPSLRRCIGDPPRQIEDPQSPPCVPFFQGDNFGATSKGVTGDTIVVVSPGGGASGKQLIADFFNRRFEFYGRRIKVVDGPGTGSPQQQMEAAAKVDEELKAFASLPSGSASVEYSQELARRQIISIGTRPVFSQADMERHRPYMWQYPMSLDKIFASLGEWACNRLVPGKARHAGDVLLRGEDRKFGLVLYNETPQRLADPAPLERELKQCGIELVVTVDIGSNFGFGDWAVTAAQKLASNGVTSVFCLCSFSPWGALANASTAQKYFPEWLVSTYIYNDNNFYVRLFLPPEQRSQAFGITVQSRQVPWPREPAAWAFIEQSPGHNPSTVGSDNSTFINSGWYRPLLLLASGIQLAGPRLTPETFERGLHMARFPNPDHPNLPSKVGFQGGSYSMTIDSAEMWWSNTDRGPYPDDSGTWCYVDNGERRRTGTWQKGDAAFFGPNRCQSGRE